MIKFSTGETVETLAVSAKTEYLSGFNRDVATITTTDLTYEEAARLFVDGAVWSIVEDGKEYTGWNAYTLAGPITDNRDGTLVIKMGAADTAEQAAKKEAESARNLVSVIAGKPVADADEAASVRADVEALFSASALDDDDKIRASNLCKEWKPGNHTVGENYNAMGQTWECYQGYDNATFPDIKPGDPSWYTFNRPLHGKTPETARKFVPVQGSHDMYRTGEYAIWTDGQIYRCKQDTNYSPADYAEAWEVYTGE